MRGLTLAEDTHVVNVLPPVDISGGKTGDVFTMEGHAHATLLLQVGVSAAAFTKILVNACSDFAGTGAEAIPFAYYAEEDSAGDVLGTRQAATAAGVTPSANDNIFYVIELDAAELPADKPFVQLQLTNGVNSVIASAVAVLSGARYAGEASATAIA